MLFKVKFYDNKLMSEYYKVLSFISVLLSIIIIFIDIPSSNKQRIGVIFFVLFLVICISLWIKANYSTKMKLKINNSIVEIKVGDIFNEKSLKVIAFNEYFDTQVDNKIISENTLNGMYIKQFINNIGELDNLINRNEHLNKNILQYCQDRPHGKKNKYKLGSIFMCDEYLLTAFSRFDDDNRAYLYMDDYIDFLLNFWNEIDILYAGRSVSIPLLGSGITRFKQYDMVSEQELLEILIWSFKVSRIKFTYPSQVSIIIHDSKKDKINLYKLKG